MNTLWQDLNYAARMLAKKPGFTLVAVITLALGIGANTAIFSVVNGVLLRPLPYHEPERLVRVYSEFPTMDLRKFWISAPEFMDIQNEAQSWEAIGAWTMGGVNVVTTGEPIRATAAVTTRGLLEALGVPPAQGRTFTPEEDVRGGPRTALISDGLWKRAFGGEADIIGKEIQIDAQPYTVIGVMPQGFVFPPGSNTPAEVWASFQFDPANPGNRGGHFLNVIGRLKPGVQIEQARAELDALMVGWKEQNRASHLLDATNHPILMDSLHEDVVASARPAVLMLLGAVGFLLLIACVNVANLLLARAEVRHREFAVRLALGASRRRMLRQFVTEGLLLVLLGAAGGILFAYAGLRLMISAAPDSVPRSGDIQIDLSVLAFTLGLSLFSVLLFALAPMAQIREQSLAAWLHGAGQKGTSGAGNQTLRRGLVIAEVALAVVLVIGAGLMLRAFWKLQQVDIGFVPQNVLTFSFKIPPTRYDQPNRLRFSNSLQERLAALPGIRSAAVVSGVPPLRPINANDTDIEGYEPTPDMPAENVDYWNTVSEDYFKTLGIRVIDGRTFTYGDRADGAQRVVVINQAMARRFWQDNPIGKRVAPGTAGEPVWYTVIGIVEDAKNTGVDKPAGPELYFLQAQSPAFGIGSTMNFVVQADGNPLAAAAAIHTAVRELDDSVPVYNLRAMSDVVGESLVRPRFLSLLLATFSAVALLLAAIGIYGVMSYAVSQSTREIGIRIALGAQKGDVLRRVIGRGMGMALIGTGIGLGAAFGLTRLMASLLFEVSATDPLAFGGVALTLLVVAFLACYIPARRATKVDPIIALRYE